MLKLARIMGSIAWKIFLLLKQIDLNLEKDMMYPFSKISGKNIKEERTTIEGELNIQPLFKAFQDIPPAQHFGWISRSAKGPAARGVLLYMI
ncbi:hypothetical protein OUZ56_026427 [Daphnia magna]|uniref:Uncharacterized protein n=1 Tax=Daphnia magna TaxID=35525 RepID=A0ABQ9ZLR0_9CRUS|nr:hypothetical protein OUZ56_026427 [Daphnia magna]